MQAFAAMDANGDGVVSFYEYTTLQLQLINPEDYKRTVKSLTTLLPQVAANRTAEKNRRSQERQKVRAAKARAFNYRLEQILSSHGGAAAVTIGHNQIPGDGARAAVRSWDSHGVESEPESQQNQTTHNVHLPERSLHWSGNQKQVHRLRMGRLPEDNLQRLAGRYLCDISTIDDDRHCARAPCRCDCIMSHIVEAVIRH